MYKDLPPKSHTNNPFGNVKLHNKYEDKIFHMLSNCTGGPITGVIKHMLDRNILEELLVSTMICEDNLGVTGNIDL